MNYYKPNEQPTSNIISNYNAYNPKLFISLTSTPSTQPTTKHTYIKRIISFIGEEIKTVDEIINSLNPLKDDSEKISDLIIDLVDNKDLVSVKGVSSVFVCHSITFDLYEPAFDAIKEAATEPGFFDSMFFDK